MMHAITYFELLCHFCTSQTKSQFTFLSVMLFGEQYPEIAFLWQREVFVLFASALTPFLAILAGGYIIENILEWNIAPVHMI